MRRLAGVVSAAVVVIFACPSLAGAKIITRTIALSKTVGLSPAICSTSTSLVVQKGTDVTYCYTVTNTGNVSAQMHMLQDDQLGNLTSSLPGSPAGTFVLNPGASRSVLKTTQINASTLNVATWTAIYSTTTWASGDTTALPELVTVHATNEAEVIVAAKSIAPAVSSAGLAGIGLALLILGGVRLARMHRRDV